jgi:hemolysin activation/secretion protein
MFSTVPGDPPPLLLPADRKLVYPWVALEWVEDRFHTARNRDQIEKTEDYSLGWRIRAQLGYASTGLGSDRNAVMMTSTLSKGLPLTDRQSIIFGASAAGRLEDGSVAGGLLDAEARYYFRQSPRRLFFMNFSTEAGSNLDQDQQVLLGDSGLRGYPLRYQAGEGRWLFTAEQRFFSNWYPFQLFNVGGAVFYDMGSTWGRDPLGTRSQGLLKDVGFGLRLGNSRSALGNILHIDVAFPLDGDSSIKNVQFLVETKRRF